MSSARASASPLRLSAARAVATIALAAAALWACRDSSDAGARRQRLTVFAASSLTEAFEDLERGFEAAHPDVDVVVSFAGSQVLRLQLEQGAEADVFASADEDHMDALVKAGVVAERQTFAHNGLVVVVPATNPAGIHDFDDLPRAERLVVGTPDVPVGRYTRRLLDKARRALGGTFVDAVERSVVSEESNVRLVRAKVELGEADAAIVYRTDAAASDRVRAVAVPKALDVRAAYPIGVVAGSDDLANARAFVGYVLSEDGRRVLAKHGFEP